MKSITVVQLTIMDAVLCPMVNEYMPIRNCKNCKRRVNIDSIVVECNVGNL